MLYTWNWNNNVNWLYLYNKNTCVCTCQRVYLFSSGIFFFNQLFSICDIWLWCGQGQSGQNRNKHCQTPQAPAGLWGRMAVLMLGLLKPSGQTASLMLGLWRGPEAAGDSIPLAAWASPFSSSLGFEIVLWTVYYLKWLLPVPVCLSAVSSTVLPPISLQHRDPVCRAAAVHWKAV